MDKRWPAMADVKIPAITVKWSSITTGALVIVWVASSLAIFSAVSNQMGPVVTVAAAQSGIKHTTSSGQLGEGGQQGTAGGHCPQRQVAGPDDEDDDGSSAEGRQVCCLAEEELDYDVRVAAKGAWIGELAKAANTTIVAGFMPESPSLKSPNLAAVWYPNGELSKQVYAKQHQVVAEGEEFQSGTSAAVYKTDFGQLGVIICFDHDFPDSSARTTVAAGANILAVPAIDPYTLSHLRWQSLVFRAVENRVPIVKTDVGFDSAIVDANGVVRDRIAVDDDAGRAALLVADVHIGPRDAPFTDTGGYTFAWFVIVGLIARYIRQFILWRRGRKS